LNQKSSAYCVAKWEEEYKEKERMMRSMSEFPQFYDQNTSGSAERVMRMKKVTSQYKLPDINAKAAKHQAHMKCIVSC